MSNPSAAGRFRGLTLIELLVAVAAFSGLMVAAGELLQAALRSQARWTDTAKPYQQMAQAFSRLEQDLESAQPFFGIPFRGTDSLLELARVETVSAGPAGPSTEWVRVSYRLEPAGGELSLVREESRWRPGEDGDARRREVLLPLARGRFAFGALDAQGQRVWVDAWNTPVRAVERLLKFDGAVSLGANRAPIAFSRVVRNPAGILPPAEGS